MHYLITNSHGFLLLPHRPIQNPLFFLAASDSSEGNRLKNTAYSKTSINSVNQLSSNAHNTKQTQNNIKHIDQKRSNKAA